MHDDNRYAPPTTALRDVEVERYLSERPAQVRWASVLLWQSFTLSVALTVYGLRAEDNPAEFAPAVRAAMVGISVGGLALSALLNVMIYRGHNWARILYLFLAGVSLWLWLMPGDEGSSLTLTETIGFVVASLLDAVAMVLVFTRPGALWFRRR